MQVYEFVVWNFSTLVSTSEWLKPTCISWLSFHRTHSKASHIHLSIIFRMSKINLDSQNQIHFGYFGYFYTSKILICKVSTETKRQIKQVHACNTFDYENNINAFRFCLYTFILNWGVNWIEACDGNSWWTWNLNKIKQMQTRTI